jgi:TonB-dependent starch-binding outer membrane protein SusC
MTNLFCFPELSLKPDIDAYSHFFRHVKLRYLFFVVLATITIIPVSAQQKPSKKIKLSGTVVDLYKLPVRNAIIIVDKGMSQTVTNNKGYYKLKVKPDAKTIAVLLDGNMNEQPINGRNIIDFKLSEVIQKEGEGNNNNVVNVGYGYTKKADVITNVNQVDGQKKGNPTFSTIYDMLRTVPGVLINGSTIYIQGITSNNSNTPLFLVNGVIVESIDNILPQDVNSIEVLKGAAAAIYGSRAANGVIMIELIKAGDMK